MMTKPHRLIDRHALRRSPLSVLAASDCLAARRSSSTATIRFSASPRRRMRRRFRNGNIDLLLGSGENLFANPGTQNADRQGARRQHDRRSSGFELVHEPHWHRPLSIAGCRARSVDRRRSRARHVVGDASQGGRVRARLHDEGREGAKRWFVSFDANGFPEAATGAILVANKIFWALGYWQVENYLVHITPKELVDRRHGRRSRPPSGKRRQDEVQRSRGRAPASEQEPGWLVSSDRARAVSGP